MANPALTPTAVNNYLKTILEKVKYMSFFSIKGEISNLKYHSNGNMYFSIKDENAQISCIMFKSYASKVTDTLVEGDQVELSGSLYLYTKMGQYNINVRTIEKAGVGDLYQKYEQLKKDYELKGYFDQQHKQKIPNFPQAIGVITSQTGAAVQDIITTLKRRYPLAKVIIYPTLVQGTNAKFDVAKNIKAANDANVCDTLIVGRGGGSIEDLWAFNEPEVVEAIFASKIPIISSVGHETDTTLSDYVADIRVPTPTAAAEIATPDISELKTNLSNYKAMGAKSLSGRINNAKMQLKYITNNQYYRDPLVNYQLHFDDMTNELKFATNKILNNININKTELVNKKVIIDSLNPLTILSKGYSVANTSSGVLRSVNDIEIDQEVTITLADGKLVSKVVSKKELNE